MKPASMPLFDVLAEIIAILISTMYRPVPSKPFFMTLFAGWLAVGYLSAFSRVRAQQMCSVICLSDIE